MTIRTLGTGGGASTFHYEDQIDRLSIADYHALGYEMFIEPTTLLGVAISAMRSAAARVLGSGRSDAVADEHGDLDQMLREWADSEEVERIHGL
jgi:hypothetical protein